MEIKPPISEGYKDQMVCLQGVSVSGRLGTLWPMLPRFARHKILEAIQAAEAETARRLKKQGAKPPRELI
jgi:hypothetical protein